MRPIAKLLFLLIGILSTPASAASAGESPQSAENFTIERQDTHTLLTVNIEAGSTDRHYRYALVPKKNELPDLPPDIPVIRTPVSRIVVMETVYIGYLDALDRLDAIAGAATVDFISHPDVRAGIESGAIKAVQVGQSLDIERLMLLQPDLILTSVSADPAFDLPPRLVRTGLPVVMTASYMEPHPLARAQWIQFIAAFFEASDQAEAFFAERAEQYAALRSRTADLENRPTVFNGAPYSGTWHVAGGESYTARMIQDAGGDYLWAEDRSQKAIPLDTERVFLKAAEADIWLHPSYYRSLTQLFGADPRFAKFEAAQTGRVYNNTRQVAANGGNNIWERGVVYPDEVLADLIHCFHPDLLPEHELIYYECLKP